MNQKKSRGGLSDERTDLFRGIFSDKRELLREGRPKKEPVQRVLQK